MSDVFGSQFRLIVDFSVFAGTIWIGMALLEEILVPRGARVYEGTHLTRAAVEEILDAVVQNLADGEEIERTVQQSMHGGMASLVVFRRVDAVSFLPSSGLRDTKHGYFLLLEKSELVLGLAKYASKADAILEQYLARLGFDDVLRLYDHNATVYEAITMRSLGGAGGLLRRAYEAPDLANVMPRAGASRSSPSRLKLKHSTSRIRISPGTGYVGEYGGSVDIVALFRFLDGIVSARGTPSSGSNFIDGFAAPLQLSELPPDVVPTHMFYHAHDILEAIENSEGLFVRSTSGGFSRASAQSYSEIGTEARTTVSLVHAEQKDRVETRPKYTIKIDDADVGFLTQGRRTLSLQLPRWRKFWIHTGSDHERLDRFVAANGMFTVTFSNPEYAYAEATVFRNRRLPEEANGLLSCLKPVPKLTNCTSEKGTLTRTCKNFPSGSVFAVIESVLAVDGAVVVCDDLGDEWADHIQLSQGHDPSIAFVHSKWSEGATASASAFHDLASQAIKNIGNLVAADSKAVASKAKKWGRTYSRTQIDRVRTRAGVSRIAKLYDELGTAIATKRIMALVAPFLSKNQFERGLKSYMRNGSLPAYATQQIWILSSFADICRANGIFPVVYCSP